MSPFAWIAIGFAAGAIFGMGAVVIFIFTIMGNLAQMLHQHPKE